ncbi:MAG: hypothetical protein COU35_03600 [Candidatus Magasanikbacteria bacterium CG10_big_fil_rev_8_21_14_0_10_47_10]|uniref:M23ase beta-sheet core domain-containing protein n=1 Tax=Candidatus Magasanikbacteria bacterium CG10_big_fil_rev_8_21_14_0_10_47_10 TaxID=1974652 RepID=A0A2H0TPZ3_9BACT|nr:MAG: hypothetical protein COU35_03600 [Candidatus Magasanikbacteria bacterium CG10_big_fil_rev_8_21_14_0_10_47_10]
MPRTAEGVVVVRHMLLVLAFFLLPHTTFAAYSGPGLKIPMLKGNPIRVTVETGGEVMAELGGGIDAAHTGNSYFSIDFDDRFSGDSVVAAAGGRATVLPNSGGYGNLVKIDHGGGYETRYGHLANFSVTSGEYVFQGQKLGTIGTTGNSSGTHIHFELKHNGNGADGNIMLDGVQLDGLDMELYRAGRWYISSNEQVATFTPTDPNALFTCPVQPSGGSAANGWVYTCPQAQDALSECDGTSLYRWSYGVLRVDNLRRNVTFRARLYRRVNGAPTVYGNNNEWSWTNNSVKADGGWDHAYFWPSEVCLEAGDYEWWYYVDSGDITMDLPLVRLPFTVRPTDTPYLVNTGSGNPISCGDPPRGGEDTNWTYTCLDRRLTYNAGQHVWTLFRIDHVYRDHRYKVSAFNNGVHQWDWTSDWVRGVSRRWGWEKTYFWPALWNAPYGNWRFYYRVDTGNGFPTAPAASVDFMVR